MEYRIYTQTEKADSFSHKVNEDHYLFSEYAFMEDKKIRLLIVADGMGGLEDGEEASANAVKGFAKAFYNQMLECYVQTNGEIFWASYFADKLKEAIKDSICEANKEVCENADPFKQTGSTISVVCIVDDYAIIANIGDSPVYFYRAKTGKLDLVSTLHTQAELDVEAGLYERYTEEYYRNDHKIYHSLGQFRDLDKEDISCKMIGRLKQEDAFLIGSDGAFGLLLKTEIQELIDRCLGDYEEFLLTKLFEEASEGKDDDKTAIFYVISKND